MMITIFLGLIFFELFLLAFLIAGIIGLLIILYIVFLYRNNPEQISDESHIGRTSGSKYHDK